MAGSVAGYLVNGLNALLGRFFVKSGTPDYLYFSFSTQSELTFAEKKYGAEIIRFIRCIKCGE